MLMGGVRVSSSGHCAEPLVRVREVYVEFSTGSQRRFGQRGIIRAVDGVSFDIDPGTTVGLVGESGSGKTTVGRAILRLIEPNRGTIHFDGVDVLGASATALRRLRRRMQIVFQDTGGSLDPRMTIGQCVAEPLVVHREGSRASRRGRVAELLSSVGLQSADATRYPHELSGGQRQRVGIARALALRPAFVVCDEAVSALDVSVQAQMLHLLEQIKRDYGLTYLFIAHDLAVVERFCDRVLVMHGGRIVEQAPTAELFQNPRHPCSRALLAAIPQIARTMDDRPRVATR